MNAGGLGGASVSDFWIRASGTTDARHMVGTVRSLQLGEIHNSFKIAKDYLDNLKFSESLPSEIAHEIVRDRMFHNEEIKATIGREVVEVFHRWWSNVHPRMDDASIHVLVAKGMKMGAAHTRVSQFKALARYLGLQ
jgi:hypothetical protein